MKFNPAVSVESINAMSKNTLMELLDIECIEVGDDYIKAKMPVDSRHHQPYGLLHGGASVVLAETLGSVAAHCSVDSTNFYCVGLEVNANHIRSVRSGYVYGVTTPIHLGKSTQVWEIKITNEEGKLVCISRITIAILEKK
ncbi:MAG: hotdog fold thioesterase [Fulvivirga sp.]|uniref:hotdog fold thioesterase n=1 Tax=Fulvivirga sp. TaxID=1931237 RepID=UPI0032EE5B15